MHARANTHHTRRSSSVCRYMHMITFTQLQRPSDTHAHSPALHLKDLVSFQQHRRLAFGMKDLLQAFSFFSLL